MMHGHIPIDLNLQVIGYFWCCYNSHYIIIIKRKSYSVFQDSSISTLLFKGAPPEKLVLGLPLYGRIFKLRNTGGIAGFQKPTEGAGMQGPYVQETGFWGYNEVRFRYMSWHF